MTQTVSLRIFVGENERHHGDLAYEWILERAKALGIHGGSAFRAIAGFGRHGSLRAEGFFEIAANLPVQVEFIVGEEQAQQLLNLLRAEKLSLPYTLSAVQFGFTAAASA
jgi:PII-like signaling protein